MTQPPADAPALTPRGVTTARNRFGKEWAVHLTHGTGTTTAQHKGPPRGDGTHPTVVVDVPCQSIALRAAHPDGRQVRAVWARRLDPTPAGGERAWSFAEAWRGRHDGEHGPAQLNAAQLAAYIEPAATVHQLHPVAPAESEAA